MTRPVSRSRIIGTIVRKDLAEYGRDKLWALLTVMTLVVAIGLFWILPNNVNESIRVGVSGLDGDVVLSGLDAAEEEGLELVAFASDQELAAAVAGEATDGPSAAIGIAFPPDFFTATAAGQRTRVTVYLDAAISEELQTAMEGVVRELAYAVAGQGLPVATLDPNEVYVVLGEDRVGDQASLRDDFRPLFVFMILVMEMFVMSSLIAKEIQDRTVTAVLVTPATIGDVLAAKGIAGTVSGMAQAVIVLVAINSITPQPLLILTLMLLGAIMVSGTAMLAGSSGKDFMGTLFYGMVYLIPLIIPAVAALFPGTASAWIRALPSYPLIRALVDVTTYGAGWSDTLAELGVLLAWCIAVFAAGWIVLKRKVQTL